MKKDLLKTLLLDQQEQFQNRDLGITREKLRQIKKHINSSYAIVISGLRRVGKSTLLSQIARQFIPQGYYFVNFEDERFLQFSANDFNLLYETLLELFGPKQVFLLDEVQNAVGWERFARRMVDQGFKFYLTGSNASLLSRELGTKLTGRYILIELFPFSFTEFLEFRQETLPSFKHLTTLQKSKLKRNFNDYLKSGGIPDALKYPEIDWHKTLYDDVIYRDIAVRYQIEGTKALKELAFYLMSNVSSLISFNKLKEMLKLGSVNTVKNYIDYLEIGWLMFTVNKYAFSIKKQQIANKKIYAIDTGLVNSISFSFSENKGKLLENLVFLALRRLSGEIYYYTTKNNLEVDFYSPKQKLLIQICQTLAGEDTKKREIRALEEAMQELSINSAVILTEDEESVDFENTGIKIIPVYKWLLSFSKEFV